MSIQTAVVTGGAGLLGRTLVHDLLQRGIKVCLPYVNEEEFRKFRGAVTEGGLLFSRKCDLSDAAEVDEFVSWARERVQAPIDALICCAGGWAGSKIGDTAPEEWKFLIDANLTHVFNVCRAIVPEMAVRLSGRVITIGGPGGLDGRLGIGQTAYAAAKGGVIAFSQALAHEVWHQGVKVNCLVPSSIVPISENEKQDGVTPEEITKTVHYLLSDDADHVNGAVIKVFGTKHFN